MKDFNDVLATIIEAKESKPELANLTTDSRVSVWGNIVWITAYAIDLLRQLFSTHKTEMENLLLTQKRHRAADIRRRLLNFQLGDALIPETDEYDNSNQSELDVEAKKIIKYAAVTESADEKRVICKIATEQDGELSQIDEDDIDAVREYVSIIKAAGVPYTVINYPADKLVLKLRIFRDPLIINSQGMDRNTGKESVKDALKEYMKELPFDGTLVLQDLCNKLESVEGVRIAQLDYALTAWLNAETENYGEYLAIDVRKTPESGYFKLDFDHPDMIIDFTNI